MRRRGVLIPERGPCGICGYPDARHRMWDVILARFLAGESIVALARDYQMTRAEVEEYLRLAIKDRRRRRRAA